jgi:hypothetical protein
VADHFYGLRFGDNLGDIVYGTSSNSDGAPASTFELRIHDGAGITKAEALSRLTSTSCAKPTSEFTTRASISRRNGHHSTMSKPM